MNIAILIGNVGQEPDIKTSKAGKLVAKVRLATSDRKDETTWHNVVCFDKTAEIVQKYVKKGDRLAVEGRIAYDSYEKDGVKRTTTDIIASRIELAGASKGAGAPAPREPGSDDDIPF